MTEVPEYEVYKPTVDQRYRALEIVLDEVATDWQLLTTTELVKVLAGLNLEIGHGAEYWPKYRYDA